MKKPTRNIARLEILNFVINFCTVKCFGTNSYSLGDKERSFHGTYFEKQTPPLGTLVKLESAPTSKYYLGWLKEIKTTSDRFSTQYLIESIEDGGLCWWHNVGIWHLPLETTDKYPEWKWTDEQFKFKDRWFSCKEKKNEYTTLPCFPEFNETGGVTLSTREWMGLTDYKATKTFDNWKKVRLKDMLEFYDYAIKGSKKVKVKPIKLS